MSMTILGWLLVVASIAITAMLIFPLRSRSSRGEQLDLETCKARLEDIGARLKLGQLNEAEADAARLALLSRPKGSSWTFGQDLRARPRALIVPASIFLLVAGIGAATSYVGDPAGATGSGDTNSSSPSHSGSNDETLTRLTDYTRSIGTEDHGSTAAAAQKLPDINTMIERLAARLEKTPDDLQGWQMLGRSYFHTARYEKAAAAFAKAVELDPSSTELKSLYEEAKAKASESPGSAATSSVETEAVGKGHDGLGVEKIAKSEEMLPAERDAQIRSMVDGLASRLESSPRDVEGWTRLMRSRVVLGEKEVATTAFRKALEVFKDDAEASAKITAAATELGLKAE
jgi:cytochrome c-type biogenesis protein CcmH